MSAEPVIEPTVSSYEDFLHTLTEEPTSHVLEAWARSHPADPDAARALFEAAHSASCDEEYTRALRLFEEVRDARGAECLGARVGVAEQLFLLARAEDAGAELAGLRVELRESSSDAAELATVYADTAMLLDEHGSEAADVIAWCDDGLARFWRGDADQTEETSTDGCLRMLTLRYELRQEAGYEPDTWDEQAAEQDEQFRKEWTDLFATLSTTREGGHPGVPDDGVAYNAVVLHWPREEFARVREAYPEQTELYGDDYGRYCGLLQREAQAYSDAGVARVFLVHGRLEDYESFARSKALDPAERQTRRDYGEWCATQHPERTLDWPLPRNGPCWCGSERKYKKCCGSPAGTG